MRVDDATSRAAQILEKIAASDEWNKALIDGSAKHDAFIAFLLAPFVTAQNPSQVLELFDRAYVLDERNEEEAIEALVQHNGWEKIRDTANRKLGFEELLTWGEDDLRAVLNDRYVFIRTYSGCFVFDREVLDPESQN